MKTLTALLTVSLTLLLMASCRAVQACAECDVLGGSCAACAQNTACEAEGGTCADCDETETASATECSDCVALMAGKTGWCEECGKGYNAGSEVFCTQFCTSRPGDPPCEMCVK